MDFADTLEYFLCQSYIKHEGGGVVRRGVCPRRRLSGWGHLSGASALGAPVCGRHLSYLPERKEKVYASQPTTCHQNEMRTEHIPVNGKYCQYYILTQLTPTLTITLTPT